MTLNKDQIEQIKNFIHSRGFTHIEVEMEILDHVATAVKDFEASYARLRHALLTNGTSPQ